MEKKLILFIFLLLFLVSFVSADTGTYELKEQNVKLTIQNNKDVIIDYSSTWKVTGGNIPWVTVWLPNSDYTINSYGGAASSVKTYNSGGWSGVYVDLDKIYYSSDEFTFNVRVIQHNFIYKYGENASIKFTPVWWDNAIVDYESIEIIPPKGVTGVTTDSEPTKFQNGSILWEFNNIERGGKRTVGLLMPIEAFPGLNETSSSSFIPFLGGSNNDTGGDFSMGGIIYVLIGAIFLVILLSVITGFGRSSYDSPSVSLSSAISSKEVKRRITMKCPNDDTILEKKTVKDVTIDYCPKCGGTFYDKSEIEILIKKGVNEDELYK